MSARTVGALRAHFDIRNVQLLVERWVNEATGESDRTNLIGDAAIRSALERRRVSVRTDSSLPFAGELRLVDNELVILLADNLGHRRRRFTIAHELGHAALFAIDSSLQQQDGDTEKLCDAFAAELLMPRAYLMREAAQVESYARLLLMLAGGAGASLPAACIRVTECFGGAAGIASRGGKIQNEYGNCPGFVNPAERLERFANDPRTTFRSERVGRNWSLDAAYTGSQYVYVVRSIQG